MAYSQNGYAAKASLVSTYTVPGTTVRISLRRGDVAVVLLYVASQFHKHVEPLRQKDTGGYNPRSIIGSHILSNHASGTAEDLNWNSHPRGRRGTFSPDEVKAVRKILAYLEGVVRWGGDYKTAPIDEMHFEIVGDAAAVARIADKIREDADDSKTRAPAAKAPAWPKGTPYYRASNHPKYSATVRAWQARMQHRGWSIAVDGRYGPRSAEVCRAFQQRKHLGVDGLLGPKTFTAAWTAQ